MNLKKKEQVMIFEQLKRKEISQNVAAQTLETLRKELIKEGLWKAGKRGFDKANIRCFDNFF